MKKDKEKKQNKKWYNCCNYRNRISSFPYLLITLGVIFLLGKLGYVTNAFSKLWPLLIIVLGLVKIADGLLYRNEDD